MFYDVKITSDDKYLVTADYDKGELIIFNVENKTLWSLSIPFNLVKVAYSNLYRALFLAFDDTENYLYVV